VDGGETVRAGQEGSESAVKAAHPPQKRKVGIGGSGWGGLKDGWMCVICRSLVDLRLLHFPLSAAQAAKQDHDSSGASAYDFVDNSDPQDAAPATGRTARAARTATAAAAAAARPPRTAKSKVSHNSVDSTE
jgi:hypothetical protein